MKFSLLHPSRQRATRSFDATQKWIHSCDSDDFELIVSIDSNDPQKDQYLALYSNVKQAKVIVNDNRSAVDAINNAAKVSTGEILIVVSDDTGHLVRWDTIIKKATDGQKDFILKVFDGIQKWIITMPIMHRDYYERFGYVYYPEYTHQFCDTELTHIADVLKKIIWRNDILIPHLHYSVVKGSVRDELQIRNDNTWKSGKSLYINRLNRKFDMDLNIWDISNEGHINWIKTVKHG